MYLCIFFPDTHSKCGLGTNAILTIYNRSSFDVIKVGQKFHISNTIQVSFFLWGHFNIRCPRSKLVLTSNALRETQKLYITAEKMLHIVLNKQHIIGETHRCEEQKRNILQDNNTWCFMVTFFSIIIFNCSSPKLVFTNWFWE